MRLIFTIILCSYHFLPFAQGWTQIADFPSTERDDGTSFTVGNKAYCGTGMTPWFATLNDFYSFDLITEQWNASASLPAGQERQYALGLSDGQYGYVFGGVSGSNYFNDLWRFDTAGSQWQALSPLPDSGRSGSCGFIINDSLYIVGGRTSTRSAIADVWAFSLNNSTWSKKNDLPYSIWRGSATASDSLGYLAFGMTDSGHYPKNLLQYFPKTDTWSNLLQYPDNGLTHGSLTLVNQYLIALGGRDSLGVYYNSLYRYDIQNTIWQKLSSIPDDPRKGGMVFTKGQNLYYTTGITDSNTRLKQTWKCDNALIGISEYSFLQWSVFPNPCTNIVHIKFDEEFGANQLELSIVDSYGKIHMQSEIDEQNWSINLESLPAGLYFANLKGSSINTTIKLLKTH